MPTKLNISSLSVQRSGRTILHPTSLSISPRDRIGLVGASGSGKSTLGHALVDDLRAQGHSVAHVPQSPDEALDPLRSMQFHWAEAERALGLTPGAADQRGIFEALSIQDADMRDRPWGWSRGMQQRFVVAMALMGIPDLIVLDEPTSALDPIVAAATMDLLDQQLASSDAAMLLITHDLGLALRRVSQLIVMDNGRVVERNETEEILEQAQSDATRALVRHRSWARVSC